MRQHICTLALYVSFLIATQKQFSGLELSRVSPRQLSHDAVSRWLKHDKLTPTIVWQEVSDMVEPTTGYVIIDDVVLDHHHARQMALVRQQYSGRHHRAVNGIGLVNMLWTQGAEMVPVDYRIYDTRCDGKTKNDHAREMFQIAQKRGFTPAYALFDAWYASVGNLKALDALGWQWISQLKKNRLVSVTKGTYVSVADLDWAATPTQQVWLKGYGFVLVSKTVTPHGDVAYLATNDLSLTGDSIKEHFAQRWHIETFHRGLKQCCGVEKCYSTVERAQRNHIAAAILAFIKLERKRLADGISWYEQVWDIPRQAVRQQLMVNA